jgi:hypothetical protein
MVEAKVKLIGLKSLLFDRYHGNNQAKPEPIEKVYWSRHDEACLPQINLYSSLSAENTKSVAKMFYGKNAKPLSMAVNNWLQIHQEDLILTRNGRPFHRSNFDSDFRIVHHVARLQKGIPNPKVRPLIDAPWQCEFDITFNPTPECNWPVMVKMLQQAGMIGLGTYRPLYGTFQVEIEEK